LNIGHHVILEFLHLRLATDNCPLSTFNPRFAGFNHLTLFGAQSLLRSVQHVEHRACEMIESMNTECSEVIEWHNVPTGYRLLATGYWLPATDSLLAPRTSLLSPASSAFFLHNLT
jgi:hypothetical protein